MSDHPNNPDTDPVAGYDDVPEDDTIIGQAFKWSVIVVVTVAALVAVTSAILRPQNEPVMVEQAEPVTARRLESALDIPPPQVTFQDITEAAGIDFVHFSGAYGDKMLPETMGGGVAFLDYDSDGHQDLLLVNGSVWPWRTEDLRAPASALLRNQGDGTFKDVTSASGMDQLNIYGMGAAAADLNGDGFPEIFLTAVGTNRLLLNHGGERFEDITETAGVAGEATAWSSGAAFFDFDNDGDLDLFVCNYVQWSRDIDLSVDYRLTGIGRAYGPPANYAGTHSYLYRNEGDGQFTDVSATAGIQINNPATNLPAGKALAIHPVDINADGRLDLVVANDTVRNFLFVNNGDGTFEESGMNSGLAFDNTGKATGAMGLDTANYNNDNDFAVAIGNFANEMSSFYVSSQGLGLFTDEAVVSGIGPDSRQALSFGLFFFDYDLDGRLDLLQTNGHVEDEINIVQPSQHYEQPTQLFWNCGPECTRNFVHVPYEKTGDLSASVVGRGAAYADIDGDGDLDVIVTQVGRRPILFRNDQALGHHWLRVKVQGQGANRDAIGARVILRAGGVEQRRLVMPSRSYLSQVELPLTFGLGDTPLVDEVRVTWPDGNTVVLEQVDADQTLTVTYPGG
jgi:hypothetical protein